jgi:Putative DNA-binding domain
MPQSHEGTHETKVTGSELRELIDSPNETLAVEYKEWLDLSDNGVRADLARHIAALANYGGGTIVFGITDTMQFVGPNPFPKVVYDRDLIAGVVKKYLEPPFQCDVQIVRSAAGNDHPIVIVPPHGAAPICAKASGPIVVGKTTGIMQGVYYVRKPGPESAPILTAAEWAPIIRRCAMHERTAILGAIDAAMRGANTAPSNTTDTLKTWHDAAHAVFLKDIAEQQAPAELAKWHCQFSYAIERGDGRQLDPKHLREILRQVNAEGRDLVRTGWEHVLRLYAVGDRTALQHRSGQRSWRARFS